MKAGGKVAVIKFAGTLEWRRSGAEVWESSTNRAIVPLPLHPGDQVRTGSRGSATVSWYGRTTQPMEAHTMIQVPEEPGKRGVNLLRGLLYLFHRDKRSDFEVKTPTQVAATLGTEFVVHVATNDTTTIQVLEGEVLMSNPFGQRELKTGEAGRAELGTAPTNTAALEAVSAMQWFLYYPAVLHLPELKLGPLESEVLRDSLADYQNGDVLGALANYPSDREPTSDTERIYLAQLVLAVGRVEEAESLLSPIKEEGDRGQQLLRLAAAIRRIITIVKLQDASLPIDAEVLPALATEWICESYYQQSQFRLEEALSAAKRAVEIAPDFAFAWERVAELQFSFGRRRQTRSALDTSLTLAPRNAQAVALQGFVFAAENRTRKAVETFDRAIQLDGALGNAWLGRGLCRIRRGDIEGGREDIQVAAAAEPQRAALRSYLGKAFNEEGGAQGAYRELDLAKELDPNDPTAWLYSALIHQQDNRINTAIQELEHSQTLNTNRSVHRSRLLLDEDRAVRSANLASVYQDANLVEQSRREAVRAVNSDYANFSGHLFLANSYNALRDPNQVNLRFETPWLSEYLVANLLAPTGAGTFSQAVSQQEYSRLFERRRLGVVSTTEYLSRGDWTQSGSQFGILENSSYSLDAFYRSRNGQRVNDDQELLTLSLQFKQQITPSDTVYLQGIYYDAEGGDLRQYYDPEDANPEVRTEESQEPILLAGYHHEWAPGSHTLFLAGWLQDTFDVQNPTQDGFFYARDNTTGEVALVGPTSDSQAYRNDLEIFTAELQQIQRYGNHTWIAGGRYQFGDYDTRNTVVGNPIVQGGVSQFERANAYGYWYWQTIPSLLLVGGVSYDWMQYPRNFRYAPLVDPLEDTIDALSPKGGVIWTPFDTTTIRAGYAQSLGGVSFDQSFQLEPTQVGGFNQAWRSMIPESVTGANSAERFENWGLSFEQKVGRGTYGGVSVQVLNSDVDRFVGAYEFVVPPSLVARNTPQRLEYEERSVLVTLNQLLGDEWSLGVRYKFSQAELRTDLQEIPSSVNTIDGISFAPKQDLESILHRVNLHVLYTHQSGFFGQLESVYYTQSNQGYEQDRPGDSFWQFNAYAGYRFARRKAEVRVGLLNITDQDYRLNPLNLRAELPRDRTLAVSFRFNF